MVKHVNGDSFSNNKTEKCLITEEQRREFIKIGKKVEQDMVKKQLLEAMHNGKPANVDKKTLEDINKIFKARKFTFQTYQQKVDKEQTTIQNLIEKGHLPLNRPKESPTQTTTGPNGGKLEAFPQRANGTYVTIETLDNGTTFECTYSETGEKLNEIKRNSLLSATITTYNGNTTDSVSINNGIVGKIQAGNILAEAPPTLEEVTGKPLIGWRST